MNFSRTVGNIPARRREGWLIPWIGRSRTSVQPPSPLSPPPSVPLFGRGGPRWSCAASWSIPHVLGLVWHDFQCSFWQCGSCVQDSRPWCRSSAGSLSRFPKTKLSWPVWSPKWECVGGRPARRLSALLSLFRATASPFSRRTCFAPFPVVVGEM